MPDPTRTLRIWRKSIRELAVAVGHFQTSESAFADIHRVARALSKAIRNGNMIFAAGNGGSAAQAQHLVAEIVGRFMKARPGLPAMALTADSAVVTAIANDFGYEEVFARQLEACAKKEDVLVVFSTSGNSANILKAIQRGKELGMVVIAVLGSGHGKVSPADCNAILCMPVPYTPRVQEMHLFVSHVLCEIVEETL